MDEELADRNAPSPGASVDEALARPEGDEDGSTDTVVVGRGVVVQPQRRVVDANAAPFGETDETCCGICLDVPPPGQIATLWCCRNVLCLKDAQNVGVCPFCREEPVVWELKHPKDVRPYNQAPRA